jgi:hypothetical protein
MHVDNFLIHSLMSERIYEPRRPVGMCREYTLFSECVEDARGFIFSEPTPDDSLSAHEADSASKSSRHDPIQTEAPARWR